MMQIPHDFPPVPKCFSHLLHSFPIDYESEDQDQTLSQSLPTRHLEWNRKSTYARSLSDNSQPPYHSSQSQVTDCNSGTPPSTTLTTGCAHVYFQDVFLEDDMNVIQNHKLKSKATITVINSPNYISPSTQRHVITKQSSFDLDDDQFDEKNCQVQDLNSPFVKLNSSLEKLQKEMKELRLFDVSLFCQLLSLHESIQDLKLNINDRYSETGSECSLGSASYMGSMSSLDEESDWGDSQVFFQSFRGEESTADDDENRQSTSSLLEQITALTQKAEEDI